MGRISTSLLLVLAGAAVACGSSDDEEQPKALEIYSWLTSGSEKAALDALLAEVTKAQPGIQITNSAFGRTEPAQKELPMRIQAGNPPDSFQVVGGVPLFEWIRQNSLEPLDSLASAQGWEAAFGDVLTSVKGKDGHIYAAPLNLERGNTLFYNKAMLTAAGFDPAVSPPSFATFFTIADALKAQGKTALSVSAAGGWTIAAAVFDSILPAQAGPEFHKTYLSGLSSGDAQQIRDTLATLGRMMDYANDDRMTVLWADSVAKVCNDQAAMLLLPDFVKGEFANLNCGPDKVGYVSMELAGSPTFIFVGMAWPLPIGAAHRDMGLEFMRITGSSAGQLAFNPLKGSIPARKDITVDAAGGFDAISTQTYADLQAAGEAVQLGYPGATPSAFQEAAANALKDFVDPTSVNFKNVDVAAAAIKLQYSTLITQ